MFKPDKVHIDVETYSSVDLKKSGVHKYAASPDFEIMLATFGYLGADKRRVFETYEVACGDRIPADRLAWLEDPAVLKFAFNATFERVCFGAMLGRPLDPAQWRCVMVKSGFAGLPLSLDRATRIAGVENVKLAGTALVNYFAKPCAPTKSNGGRRRNLPEHAPEKWADYVAYNKGDVAAEWDLDDEIDAAGVRIPAVEWEYYAVDQSINDRGVMVDRRMAANAVNMATGIKSGLIAEIEAITGVANGASPSQLLAWLNDRGAGLADLTAENVRAAVEADATDPDVARVLALREQASRTTSTKYAAMLECADGADDRARGCMQFNGAWRTGRFAGRRIQPQNMARITLDDSALTAARELVRAGDAEMLCAVYDRPLEVLGQLTRTALVAPEHRVLIAADYSAIEARGLAWLAGEEWKLDVFRTHGKIYEATAARMFNVPIESVTKGSDFRQKGKVAELYLGYGGAVGAFDRAGYLRNGSFTEAEASDIVGRWRAGNPAIVKLWADLEQAALRAVRCPDTLFEVARCAFESTADRLFVRLPSGRELVYFHPRIRKNRWGGPSVWYEGENLARQWTAVDTYGGKLAENITQALCRDLLCHAMLLAERAGYQVVMHVHDELVVETYLAGAERARDEIYALMTTPPEWAPDLPLKADGFISQYYKK